MLFILFLFLNQNFPVWELDRFCPLAMKHVRQYLHLISVELQDDYCTFQKGGMNYKLFQTIEIMTTGSEHTSKPYMVLHFRNDLGWKMKPASLLAVEFS